MSPPRATLRGVMAGVAVVAANLALLRAASVTDLALVGGPAVLVLEFALWRAWRDRRPGRAFWLGYLLLGGLATVSINWWVANPTRYGWLPDGSFGVVRPAAPLGATWGAILGTCRLAAGATWRWAVGPPGDAAEFAGAVAGVWGLQVSLGVVGGLVGRGLAGWRVASASGVES